MPLKRVPPLNPAVSNSPSVATEEDVPDLQEAGLDTARDDFINSAAVVPNRDIGGAASSSNKPPTPPAPTAASGKTILVQFNSRVPPDIDAAVDAFCQETGIKKQRVVADALSEYLANRRPK